VSAYLSVLGGLSFQGAYKISNLFLVEQFEVSLQNSEAIGILNVFSGKLDKMLDLIIPGLAMGRPRAYRGLSKDDVELKSIVILLEDRVHAIVANKDTDHSFNFPAKDL
jgi:hypothetical protein